MSPVTSKSSRLWQFSYVKVRQNLNFTKFWNPEILLNFWDFALNFCMWPLNVPSNKQRPWRNMRSWLLPWFPRGRSLGHRFRLIGLRRCVLLDNVILSSTVLYDRTWDHRHFSVFTDFILRYFLFQGVSVFRNIN